MYFIKPIKTNKPMKLYTEEQVLKAIQEARYYSDLIKPNNIILNKLTSIELPSDEEIEKAANTQSHYEGAMWFKYKILNQNK